MMIKRFQDLLQQTIGLDAASIGTSAVERAVQTRARACALADHDLYWAHVSSSGRELQALIEAVVVPETWFYRDRQAFDAMTRWAIDEWLPTRVEGTVLRLLSLPCSSGEEPYTMAMALLDAGLPAEAFRIDAIDISGPALQAAAGAIYGQNSFRGRDLAYRDRHFNKTNSGKYRLNKTVHLQVKFRQGNLFEGTLGSAAYDIVFCRNVLIYFDMQDQRRAVDLLRRLLTDTGILFVGHSETSLLIGEGFASTRVPLAFAFRKTAVPIATARPKARRPVANASTSENQRKSTMSAPAATHPITVPRSLPEICALDQIRRLAGCGDLNNAVKQGEAYLRAHGANTEALHLMGVITEATGDLDAAGAYYRKALYLDPEQDETLTHLELLLEKQGEAEGARVTRDRARRLRERRRG